MYRTLQDEDDITLITAEVTARLAPLLCGEPPNNAYVICAALVPFLTELAQEDAAAEEAQSHKSAVSRSRRHPADAQLSKVLGVFSDKLEDFELRSCLGKLKWHLFLASFCMDTATLDFRPHAWPSLFLCSDSELLWMVS